MPPDVAADVRRLEHREEPLTSLVTSAATSFKISSMTKIEETPMISLTEVRRI
jgi:hypothetical protein